MIAMLINKTGWVQAPNRECQIEKFHSAELPDTGWGIVKLDQVRQDRPNMM